MNVPKLYTVLVAGGALLLHAPACGTPEEAGEKREAVTQTVAADGGIGDAGLADGGPEKPTCSQQTTAEACAAVPGCAWWGVCCG